MSFVVKKTILAKIAEILCPSSCIYCGKIGGSLCACCKNNIIAKQKCFCLYCNEPLDGGHVCRNSACELCHVRQFCIGERKDALRLLINCYKYQARRSAVFELADLASSILPDEDLYFVPLPTIERHKRERGFDHIALLARKIVSANKR